MVGIAGRLGRGKRSLICKGRHPRRLTEPKLGWSWVALKIQGCGEEAVIAVLQEREEKKDGAGMGT